MKDRMKDTIKTYTHEGKQKVQFVNKENNTTMTYAVQDVLDVINEIKGM